MVADSMTFSKAIGLVVILATFVSADRPDVFLIMVDDLRPMLGCYGDERMKTPNIDRLAKRGVIFDNAYCQYAKCGTSRLSMMTGLRPHAIHIYSNNIADVEKFRRRRADAMTLPRFLKSQGYHVQSFGKIFHDGWEDPSDWSTESYPGRDREMWEVVDEKDPTRPTRIAERLDCPVMQSPNVEDSHLFAGRMTDRVLQALRRDRDGKPRFYAVGYRRPHLPFVAPKKYYDLYTPTDDWLAKDPLPSPRAPIAAWFNSDGYVGSAKKIGLTMPRAPTREQAIAWNGYELRSYVGVPNQGPIEKSLQIKLLHAYAACISYVDAQIGRLLNAITSSANSENTYIVFCSDHGWHLGEHSAWGKMTNFEVATRVPFAISGPGISSRRSRVIAELVDVYPTVCESDRCGSATTSPRREPEQSGHQCRS